MKKSVFYLMAAFAAIVAAAGCSNSKTPILTINGTVDSEIDTVYITTRTDTLSVAPVSDGAFSTTLALDQTPSKTLYVRNNKTRSSAIVFAEPGTVTLSQEDRSFSVVGTPANDAYKAYVDKASELSKAYGQTEDEAERQAISDEYDKNEQDAFENNTSNYFGVYMLQNLQYSMEAEELEEAIAKLDPKFAEDETVVKLADRVEILKKTAVGQPFIDIKLADRNGTDIALSDIVSANKYVLLDFWASWCGPCMGEVPYLVPTYGQYKKKGFEIYGVSLDNTADKWTAAIDSNKMNWVHVSDLKYWQSAGAALYGVNSIPANYLISQDGTIVAKNLRGEALAEKLAELLD